MHGVFDVGLDIDPVVTNVNDFGSEVNNRILNIYPNPLIEEGSVEVYIKEPANINLSVFSVDGRKVKIIADKNMTSGKHQFDFNKFDVVGLNLSPEIYITQLKINEPLKDAKRFIVR